MLAALLAIGAAALPAAARCAQTLDLSAPPEIVDLTPYVDVYEDPASSRSFDDVRSSGAFEPVQRLRLGNRRATYWLRLRYSGAAALRPWILTAGYRPYEADFYVPDGAGYRIERSGDAVPYALRPYPIFNWIAFEVPVAAGTQTAYLRLRTIEPLVNVVAYTQERFRRDITRDIIVVAALLAILGSLVLSSVVLYFVMRDTLYLYYAGYIVAQIVYRANDFGLLQAYGFPHASFPYVRTEVFFDGVTLVAATFFIRRFLRSHAHSRLLDRINVAIAVIGAIYAVLALAGVPISYTLVQNFSFVYVPIWIATGVVCWRKGYAPAKLFLAAWTAYMIGIVVEAAVDAGTFQAMGIMRESTPDVLLDYIVYLGIALESILLALSLAQAYRTASAEKIRHLTDLLDVQERVERMAHLAYSDCLTNLPNRIAFIERVEESLRAAQRHGRRCALLFLDFDKFKDINDTLGHLAGDATLIEAAARLRKTVRGDEMIGRIGGDEFAIFLPSIESNDDV
ncbi:MAG: GGDEF domain-containing protein, partial [Candidatus Eremiobacteraeota bacterium]|nr:GGDEF domain-containing protein [Candidatus Eremiobacteraeota bacterium]